METSVKSNRSGSWNSNSGLYLRTSSNAFYESESVTVTEYCDELSGRSLKKSGSLALQIYLPFCATQCLNCASHVTVTHDPAEIDRYIDSLEREIGLVVDRAGTFRHLTQLHIGGGSPNYLNDFQLVRLMSIVEKSFHIAPTTEMSIEANARHTSATQLDLLHGLGFTRISFSVSDLDPLVQFTIGRSQSVDMLQEVFAVARHSGFETISTDIMYGLPNQSTQSMRQTVAAMIALKPDRISSKVYNRRTDLFPHQYGIGGDHLIPSVADKLALLNVIVEGLSADAYSWVGLDHFMLREDPLCHAQLEHKLKRNWLGYTVADTASVLGFGINSISEVGQVCVQNHQQVPVWRESLDTGELPIRSGFRMNSAFKRHRGALSELMCNLESDDCGALLEADKETHEFDGYQERGLLQVKGNRIEITTEGRYLLPQIWSESMPSQLRWSYPS